VEDLTAERATASSCLPGEVFVDPEKKHPEPGVEEEGRAQWSPLLSIGKFKKE
jgi:hypothetical protein